MNQKQSVRSAPEVFEVFGVFVQGKKISEALRMRSGPMETAAIKRSACNQTAAEFSIAVKNAER
jgi:hypothetical protein